MSHAHGSLAPTIADLHVEGDLVRVTLRHDPALDGVEMALYVDGSASMVDEFTYRDSSELPDHDDHDDHAPPATLTSSATVDRPAKKPAPRPGWIARLFGWFRGDDHDEEHDDDHGAHATAPTREEPPRAKTGVRTNEVEPQVRRMLAYLARKDHNGRLRLAYWACGPDGEDIEQIGELSGEDADTLAVPGPKDPGSLTRLAPAMRDFIAYLRSARGVKRACGVFITDGQIADMGAVQRLTRELGAQVNARRLPPLHLVLVGIGEQVNERQLATIADTEVPGVDHLWCHRVAHEMHEMASLVSGLVDRTMVVAPRGAVFDDEGERVAVWERGLPGVIEFRLPAGHRAFTLDVDGARYTQPLPDGRAH